VLQGKGAELMSMGNVLGPLATYFTLNSQGFHSSVTQRNKPTSENLYLFILGNFL